MPWTTTRTAPATRRERTAVSDLDAEIKNYHREVKQKAMVLAKLLHNKWHDKQPERFPEWERMPRSEQELMVEGIAGLIYEGMITLD